MTDELEDDEAEWGLGVYQPVVIPEPEGQRLTRIAEARKAGQQLWENVCKELRRDR